MKRVLPLLLIVSALEIWGITELNIWLFKDRYVNISEITVLKHNTTESGRYYTIFRFNGKEYEAYNQIDYINSKSEYIKYDYSENYFGFTILVIIFTACFSIYFLLRTIDCFLIYDSDDNIGDRFNRYESIFPKYYANLLNAIDAYDLSPFKNRIRSFGGYE